MQNGPLYSDCGVERSVLQRLLCRTAGSTPHSLSLSLSVTLSISLSLSLSSVIIIIIIITIIIISNIISILATTPDNVSEK